MSAEVSSQILIVDDRRNPKAHRNIRIGAAHPVRGRHSKGFNDSARGLNDGRIVWPPAQTAGRRSS